MRRSWTLDLLKEWSPRISAASLIRLMSRLIREQKGKVQPGKTMTPRMKQPFQATVALREWGSDLATLEEIVVAEVYKTVVLSLSQVRTVIDLGANIGLASLYFAHHWPACRILAVEPNPEIFAILESNLASLVGAGRCETLQAAAWNANVRLSSVQEPGHFSVFEVHEAMDSQGTNSTVEGLTIADIIDYSGFGNIDLIKVDIEGAEMNLFTGDVSWLSRVGNIAIEFHGNSRTMSGFDKITQRYGFRGLTESEHTVLVSKAG